MRKSALLSMFLTAVTVFPRQETKPQTQVRVNYLNVCAPSKDEQAVLTFGLDKMAAKPVFADDFESGVLGARWDELSPAKEKALSFAPAMDEICGRRCLRVEARLGENHGGGLTKWFQPVERVFVRFYVRFDPGCDYVHHFVTLRANKGLRGGDKWSGFGGAGERPAGEGDRHAGDAVTVLGDDDNGRADDARLGGRRRGRLAGGGV